MDIKIQFKELINKILLFEITHKIEKSLDILVKKTKTQIYTIRKKSSISQQTPMKFRGSLRIL
jgi:hypothetical protein